MKPPIPDPFDRPREAALGQSMVGFFDAKWYLTRYADVARAGLDPLSHFLTHGAAEGRDPNRWFDSAWYAEHYPDVGTSGGNSLLHYLQSGAAELRNPHPRFDAVYYVDQHPESAANPLLFHLRVGVARGWLTEKPIEIADYLPSKAAPPVMPSDVMVDVVIPVYQGLEQTQRCIESVLADLDRPPGRIIVIDDKSPDPALSSWLTKRASTGAITLLRNRRNLGFVASVNLGMREAGDADVVLLNSDTEVPTGWLRRLGAQAYAGSRIASVSPFSNNATICGYPRAEGGPLPFGRSLAEIDDACRAVNAGRSVDLPTTVGFCMYIRRAALNELGLFDEETFGRGYGEENDFCMRASTRGWRHRLACDVFVYHEGSVSFGPGVTTLVPKAQKLLEARYPAYARIVSQHVRLDAVGPARIAVTAALFKRSSLPTILMVCHDLGGGVWRHVELLVQRMAGRANCLLLRSTVRGAELSVPALVGHPVLDLPAERLDDLVIVLRSAGVSRVHIHHLAGMDIDVRGMIHRLGVDFDLTVHDYHAICPQVNLLPWPEGQYCGEPGPAGCNACIANRPSHGARDILSWRRDRSWQFLEAGRVICPSTDLRDRLARYGLADRAIVAPHEPVPEGWWPIKTNKPSAKGTSPLRIALLGILANHKGAHVVISVAAQADPTMYEFHLIGDVQDDFPDEARANLRITGKYEEDELPALLARIRPDVLWFPATWPETYSYTLSAGIASGLPIVAGNLGAFPERLHGRPMTWLVDPTVDTAPWLLAFENLRAALRGASAAPPRTPRPPVADFYADAYLVVPEAGGKTKGQRPIRRGGGSGRISVVVIPERFPTGALTPCAFIRLLLPLDHPAIGSDLDIVLADAETALDYRADIIVTQRHGVDDVAAADAIADHARATGAALVYDLDDDLANVPRDHPDASELRPKARAVQRMLRHADTVFVSSSGLATSLSSLRPDAVLLPNGLDERLWGTFDMRRPDRYGPVRILCMGTATHDADFKMIEPDLARIKEEFGGRVVIDMAGFSGSPKMPDWVNRLNLPPTAVASYPGFVNWICRQPGWDIGLAPLRDTPFNRCKSPIKTLDYAAVGMAVLASDVDVYRGSLADGGDAGMLVANESGAWYAAISRLLRDVDLRLAMRRRALDAFLARGTLAAQAEMRRRAWMDVLAARKPVVTRSRRRVATWPAVAD